jgi:hypothetical protein
MKNSVASPHAFIMTGVFLDWSFDLSKEWTKKQMTTEQLGAEGLAKGDVSTDIVSTLLSIIYNGKGASNLENKTGNKALGLQTSSLEEIIKEAVQRQKIGK